MSNRVSDLVSLTTAQHIRRLNVRLVSSEGSQMTPKREIIDLID